MMCAGSERPPPEKRTPVVGEKKLLREDND